VGCPQAIENIFSFLPNVGTPIAYLGAIIMLRFTSHIIHSARLHKISGTQLMAKVLHIGDALEDNVGICPSISKSHYSKLFVHYIVVVV
jgi:hypothetical protein